jgi:tetratricopeptide (TPR) repeat protein
VAFINGNYDNALLNYNSAALADDGDSQILINICHTLLALNRKTEAKEIYEKAVILDAEVTQLYPHLKTKVQ